MSALETIRFPISGMTCGSCVSRITRALRRVDGVARVRVDLADEAATVARDPDRATDALLAAAVAGAGYAADLGTAVVVPAWQDRGLIQRLLGRSR